MAADRPCLGGCQVCGKTRFYSAEPQAGPICQGSPETNTHEPTEMVLIQATVLKKAK